MPANIVNNNQLPVSDNNATQSANFNLHGQNSGVTPALNQRNGSKSIPDDDQVNRPKVNPPPGFPPLPTGNGFGFNPAQASSGGFMFLMYNPYFMMGMGMQASDSASGNQDQPPSAQNMPFMWPGFFPNMGHTPPAPTATVSRPPDSDSSPDTSRPSVSSIPEGDRKKDPITSEAKRRKVVLEPGENESSDDVIISTSEDEMNSLDSDITAKPGSGSILRGTEIHSAKSSKLPAPPVKKSGMSDTNNQPTPQNDEKDQHLPPHIRQAKRDAEKMIEDAHGSIKSKGEKNVKINGSMHGLIRYLVQFTVLTQTAFHQLTMGLTLGFLRKLTRNICNLLWVPE